MNNIEDMAHRFMTAVTPIVRNVNFHNILYGVARTTGYSFIFSSSSMLISFGIYRLLFRSAHEERPHFETEDEYWQYMIRKNNSYYNAMPMPKTIPPGIEFPIHIKPESSFEFIKENLLRYLFDNFSGIIVGFLLAFLLASFKILVWKKKKNIKLIANDFTKLQRTYKLKLNEIVKETSKLLKKFENFNYNTNNIDVINSNFLDFTNQLNDNFLILKNFIISKCYFLKTSAYEQNAKDIDFDFELVEEFMQKVEIQTNKFIKSYIEKSMKLYLQKNRELSKYLDNSDDDLIEISSHNLKGNEREKEEKKEVLNEDLKSIKINSSPEKSLKPLTLSNLKSCNRLSKSHRSLSHSPGSYSGSGVLSHIQLYFDDDSKNRTNGAASGISTSTPIHSSRDSVSVNATGSSDNFINISMNSLNESREAIDQCEQNIFKIDSELKKLKDKSNSVPPISGNSNGVRKFEDINKDLEINELRLKNIKFDLINESLLIDQNEKMEDEYAQLNSPTPKSKNGLQQEVFKDLVTVDEFKDLKKENKFLLNKLESLELKISEQKQQIFNKNSEFFKNLDFILSDKLKQEFNLINEKLIENNSITQSKNNKKIQEFGQDLKILNNFNNFNFSIIKNLNKKINEELSLIEKDLIYDLQSSFKAIIGKSSFLDDLTIFEYTDTDIIKALNDAKHNALNDCNLYFIEYACFSGGSQDMIFEDKITFEQDKLSHNCKIIISQVMFKAFNKIINQLNNFIKLEENYSNTNDGKNGEKLNLLIQFKKLLLEFESKIIPEIVQLNEKIIGNLITDFKKLNIYKKSCLEVSSTGTTSTKKKESQSPIKKVYDKVISCLYDDSLENVSSGIGDINKNKTVTPDYITLTKRTTGLVNVKRYLEL
ncbi:hypothetical protein PACTADRAFT_80277 [Pachysolen tannophilus NRRL Y-2460]|uniref:Uncharacterized protein n=1 Tax=Pachysolen tannophilus NRRL Y-2460 TaxID=669874 RepID=A0A1E4TWW9_PACTA|nr:hypothetical protein PACTADRAFT_80277 [Pachysolen tannophilus NRRL Y-2460]